MTKKVKEIQGPFITSYNEYTYYDDAEMTELRSEGFDIYEKYLKGKLFWETGKGKKINVKDMDEMHIRNCIKLPPCSVSKYWVRVFKFELTRVRNKPLKIKI